jgi:hypothetical protein
MALKDWGKTISGLVFETDPKPANSVSPTEVQPSVETNRMERAQTAVSSNRQRISVGDVSEMKTKVLAHLEAGHPEAYLAYMKFMETLKATVPEEGQRIKTVLTVLATQNTTSQAVLKAFEERVKEVDEYRKGFVDQTDREKETKVGALNKKRETIVNQIAGIEDQIRTLQESASKLRNERDQNDLAISAESERIALVERQMDAVLTDIRSEFQAEYETVASHILPNKGGN